MAGAEGGGGEWMRERQHWKAGVEPSEEWLVVIVVHQHAPQRIVQRENIWFTSQQQKNGCSTHMFSTMKAKGRVREQGTGIVWPRLVQEQGREGRRNEQEKVTAAVMSFR